MDAIFSSQKTGLNSIYTDQFWSGSVSGNFDAAGSGSDNVSVIGSVAIAGDLSATESGLDSANIAGHVDNGGVTGFIYATEIGADATETTGSVAVSGEFIAVETGADTANISGLTIDGVQPAVVVTDIVDSNYIVGGLVRITVGIADFVSGSAVDVSSLVLKVRKADRSLLTLTYGADSALVRDNVGNYHADIVLDVPGVWFWRWEAAGNNSGVAENRVTVRSSYVL